jgi:hypothetical protein
MACPIPSLAGVIHESDERSADLRTLHTEFTECFNFGIMEPLNHRWHGEHLRASPCSLCSISVTSV